MLNKIIRRGHRKSSKTDVNESGAYSYNAQGYRNSESVSTSNVVLSHASRALPVSTSTNSNSQSGSTAGSSPTGTLEILPLLRNTNLPDRHKLFLRKLNNCLFQLDFTDSMIYLREKEIKRQTLLELVDFIQSGVGKITENGHEEMVRMISVNLFRCLPPSSHENTGSEAADPEEEEPYLEPSWPHLQLVYELLMRYIVSPDTDTKIAKRYVDHAFVLKLLDLFDSEDPREREYLKTILHRIYGKFMVHRPFIRKAINNIFYLFIYETERHCGIGELLEILGSIINGFALPMKEEHRLFLIRALIPLHKPKSVASYHQQLSYCIIQFAEKDCKLCDPIIKGLLKYWPVTNCQKEVLFLGELEEVLEATEAEEFQGCMVILFRQMGRCLNSSHFQVAERALFLWNNEHIVNMIAENRSVILPLIFESLEKNIRGHWNQMVNGLTVNVKKMFLEMDTELFEECGRRFAEKEAEATDVEERRTMIWQKLDDDASEDDRIVALVVGDDNMITV